MSRNVHDLIGDISEMLDEVECEYINVSEDRDYLGRELKDIREKYEDLKEENDALGEDNDLLDEKFRKFQYDCGYEEGFENGKYSMQKKAYKICEYWNNNDMDVLSKLFDGWTWTQIFENIETAYDKIIEYEKKKEQEEKEIHVGDEVVDVNGQKYIVRKTDGLLIYLLQKNGYAGSLNYSNLSKTGKHYPLEEMLKELK
jgi:hypothetical protein